MLPGAAVPRLLLVAAAVLFSTGGAAIKAVSLGPWAVVSFRAGIAALALLLMVPAARRGWSGRILPVSLAYAAMVSLFVLSNKLTTSANAIFLQSTAPVYILLLGPWLLQERVSRQDLLFAGAVAAGMGVLFQGTESVVATAPDPARGNVIAAFSGVSWALTLTGLRWLGRYSENGSAASAAVAGNLIAFTACLPLALPAGPVSARDVLALGYLGVFQVGLGYACVTRAISRVPAFETSALLLIEPALNPVWAWALHGERPSAHAIAGGAIILLAILVNTARSGRRQ
jgi:DME family drug/metabolite transporter